MKKKKKGSVDRSETFDDFLAKEGLLAETEDSAIKEIIADQIKVAMDKQGLSKDRNGGADEDQSKATGPIARSGQSFGDASDVAESRERGGEKFKSGVGIASKKTASQMDSQAGFSIGWDVVWLELRPEP